MKVNTDGVLLGAIAHICTSDRNVLDIGTGTGTIALMLAQRMAPICGDSFKITGIDIDEPSFKESEENFKRSPWKEHLFAANISLQRFFATEKFDLIVSNPPFYDESLVNPNERLGTARHSVSLSFVDILCFAETNLNEGGRLSLILPSDVEMQLLREARSRGLFLNSIHRVRTTPEKASKRIICQFSTLRSTNPEDVVLTIREGETYSGEYLSLMKDFYLFA